MSNRRTVRLIVTVVILLAIWGNYAEVQSATPATPGVIDTVRSWNTLFGVPWAQADGEGFRMHWPGFGLATLASALTTLLVVGIEVALRRPASAGPAAATR